MSRFSYLVREAIVNLRRNALVVVGAVLAVFISLTLAFGALVVNEILRKNTLAWQEGVHVIAFLKDEGSAGVSTSAHNALQLKAESWDEVLDVIYCDKACAWEEYQQIFSGQPDLLDIDRTVLPASLRLELVDPALHAQVRFQLEQETQVVKKVTTASEEIETLQNLSSALNVLGIGLAIVLGLSAVVLIANTIRLAIYARRDEVEIMKLVGASNWYIRIPFLLEGLIEGLLGAGFAVFAVWLAASRLKEAASSFVLFSFDVGNPYLFRWGILFLIFGALAGVLGSLLGLSRYLRDADGVGSDIPTGTQN